MEPSSHFILVTSAGVAGVFSQDPASQRVVDRKRFQWLNSVAFFAGAVHRGFSFRGRGRGRE